MCVHMRPNILNQLSDEATVHALCTCDPHSSDRLLSAMPARAPISSARDPLPPTSTRPFIRAPT